MTRTTQCGDVLLLESADVKLYDPLEPWTEETETVLVDVTSEEYEVICETVAKKVSWNKKAQVREFFPRKDAVEAEDIAGDVHITKNQICSDVLTLRPKETFSSAEVARSTCRPTIVENVKIFTDDEEKHDTNDENGAIFQRKGRKRVHWSECAEVFEFVLLDERDSSNVSNKSKFKDKKKGKKRKKPTKKKPKVKRRRKDQEPYLLILSILCIIWELVSRALLTDRGTCMRKFMLVTFSRSFIGAGLTAVAGYMTWSALSRTQVFPSCVLCPPKISYKDLGLVGTFLQAFFIGRCLVFLLSIRMVFSKIET